MNDNMLRIENLTVRVDGQLILKDFSISINKGEVHVLLGPNGAGKTTLIKTILGYKKYVVESGKIFFKGEDITNLSISDRVSKGIGVLFQRPPEINGVKLSKLLSVCDQKRNVFTKETSENACDSDLDEYMDNLAKRLKFSKDYLERDINTGISGGEIKRSEILQMMVMQPDLLLFDEPDSGVDVENVEIIASVMRELLDRDKVPSKQEKSGLIITHLGYILKFLGHITRAHIVMNGKILCSGNPKQIINAVMKNGFEKCRECITCIDPTEKFEEVDFTL